MRIIRAASALALLLAGTSAPAQEAVGLLDQAGQAAQQELRQSFANLDFEDFGPSPVKGPIYQAMAGGRLIYFAPESDHLLFAAIYDRSGVNVTALSQDEAMRRRVAGISDKAALSLGPPDAPTVIEFTDPDCPYCRALERWWESKAAEGKVVRRLIYFVTGIHPAAAAKAQHILCAPDQAAAFRQIYAGAAPGTLLRCAAGESQLAAQGEVVRKAGVSGTPTLIIDGRILPGFQQAELEAFLAAQKGGLHAAH